MFKKILIANRGEIAVRIMKACRDLDIKTVAIYSDADKDAFYLREADEIYNIGPAIPIKSYLNIEAIIDVIKSGADAVHPGYGFLSENYSFAEEVVSNGVAWIGPPPKVMEAIESKCYCREIASMVSVPIIPGTIAPFKNMNELYDVIPKIGLPVFLTYTRRRCKGIEVIHDINQVKDVWERVSGSTVAFNSTDCYLEKQVVNPRHIEIQFLSDKSGKCLCLGERVIYPRGNTKKLLRSLLHQW